MVTSSDHDFNGEGFIPENCPAFSNITDDLIKDNLSPKTLPLLLIHSELENYCHFIFHSEILNSFTKKLTDVTAILDVKTIMACILRKPNIPWYFDALPSLFWLGYWCVTIYCMRTIRCLRMWHMEEQRANAGQVVVLETEVTFFSPYPLGQLLFWAAASLEIHSYKCSSWRWTLKPFLSHKIQTRSSPTYLELSLEIWASNPSKVWRYLTLHPPLLRAVHSFTHFLSLFISLQSNERLITSQLKMFQFLRERKPKLSDPLPLLKIYSITWSLSCSCVR